jgi:hypothetical protein
MLGRLVRFVAVVVVVTVGITAPVCVTAANVTPLAAVIFVVLAIVPGNVTAPAAEAVWPSI